MKRHKVTSNFYVDEFMHPTAYKLLGKLSARLINNNIYVIMQELRNDIGKPITVNNWVYGGRFKNRGLRLPFSTVGAWRSQHKLGNACDFHVKDFSPLQVYDFIMQNEDKYLNLGLTRMEDPRITRTWLHIDCKKTGKDGIHTFAP